MPLLVLSNLTSQSQRGLLFHSDGHVVKGAYATMVLLFTCKFKFFDFLILLCIAFNDKFQSSSWCISYHIVHNNTVILRYNYLGHIISANMTK